MIKELIRALSVAEYVIFPQEQLIDVKSVDVCLMAEIVKKLYLNGCDKIPDHSVLTLEVELQIYNHVTVSQQMSETLPTAPVRYNLTNIPSDFMIFYKKSNEQL